MLLSYQFAGSPSLNVSFPYSCALIQLNFASYSVVFFNLGLGNDVALRIPNHRSSYQADSFQTRKLGSILIVAKELSDKYYT